MISFESFVHLERNCDLEGNGIITKHKILHIFNDFLGTKCEFLENSVIIIVCTLKYVPFYVSVQKGSKR